MRSPFFLTVTHLVLTTMCVAQNRDSGSGKNDVFSITEDVKPFSLDRDMQYLWPYDTRSKRPQKRSWGVREEWKRPREEPSVWTIACAFRDRREAKEAARIYSVSMTVAFREGGVAGESFGEKCWHNGIDAVTFSRGPFAFAVGVWGVKQNEKVSVLTMFARALDKKAKEFDQGGKAPVLVPRERPDGRSLPNSTRLKEAIVANSIQTLTEYVASHRPLESSRAISALAKSPKGREALINLIGKEQMDEFRVALMLSTLGNVGTPDAIDYLLRYVQTAKSPKLYATAVEAAAEAMPEHQSREFYLKEVKRLAPELEASAPWLTPVVKGLVPTLRPTGDPEETVILRVIAAKTRNEKLQAVCLRTLAQWVLDQADLRDEILRIMGRQLKHGSPRVRVCAARTLGRSRDPRNVVALLPLLDDPAEDVSTTAAEAVCGLLGWRFSKAGKDETGKVSIERLKTRLKPVLKALEAFDATVKQSAE